MEFGSGCNDVDDGDEGGNGDGDENEHEDQVKQARERTRTSERLRRPPAVPFIQCTIVFDFNLTISIPRSLEYTCQCQPYLSKRH